MTRIDQVSPRWSGPGTANVERGDRASIFALVGLDLTLAFVGLGLILALVGLGLRLPLAPVKLQPMMDDVVAEAVGDGLLQFLDLG
jgi:hypothetical protein